MGRNALKFSALRHLFLVVGIGFSLYLVASVVYNSASRKSVMFATHDELDEFSSVAVAGVESRGSLIHIEKFHRVEVKRGQRQWEVKARDARYFAKDGVSQMNDVKLTIYRPDKTRVNLFASAAKLHLREGQLERADLEGKVLVKMQGGTTISGERAVFDNTRSLLTAFGPVEIEGQGYKTTGIGMRANLDSKLMTLLNEVKSKFELDKQEAKNGGALRELRRFSGNEQ